MVRRRMRVIFPEKELRKALAPLLCNALHALCFFATWGVW
jgi:hypothetical protein